MGLYPIIKVNKDAFSPDSEFVSQDQLGRIGIAHGVWNEYTEKNKEDTLVIDYAGGTANLTEQIIRIASANGGLPTNLKFLVMDYAKEQLKGGKARIEKLGEELGIDNLSEHVYFAHANGTIQLDDGPHFDDEKESPATQAENSLGINFNDIRKVGVTSYTLGAIDKISQNNDESMAVQMAIKMGEICDSIYAVDFSAPYHRETEFLEQTGKIGEFYQRGMTGKIVGKELKNSSRLEKSWVNFMGMLPGLTSHYLEAWPDVDGHEAGNPYRSESGEALMELPSILKSAKKWKDNGYNTTIMSKVLAFSAIPYGNLENDEMAAVLVPGWIADTIIAKKLN